MQDVAVRDRWGGRDVPAPPFPVSTKGVGHALEQPSGEDPLVLVRPFCELGKGECPYDLDLSLPPAAFPPSRARNGLPKRSFSSGARFATSLSSALGVRSSPFEPPALLLDASELKLVIHRDRSLIQVLCLVRTTPA